MFFCPKRIYFTNCFSTLELNLFNIGNFIGSENVNFWSKLTLNGQKMNHLSAARLNFSFKKIILISKIILVIKGQSKRSLLIKANQVIRVISEIYSAIRAENSLKIIRIWECSILVIFDGKCVSAKKLKWAFWVWNHNFRGTS